MTTQLCQCGDEHTNGHCAMCLCDTCTAPTEESERIRAHLRGEPTSPSVLERKAVNAALSRANEHRESWSQIARAQARELTKLRAAAQRVVALNEDMDRRKDDDNGLEGLHEWWAALDALTFALTPEPTEATDAG